MQQQGYIVEIVDSKTAKLRMQRHSACASCGKCATTSEKQDVIVEVDNVIGAKLGDKVEVNMESVNVLKAAVIVYILPLIGLLGGTIATYYILEGVGGIKNIEIISGIVGVVLTIVAFLILRANDNKFRDSKEYIPTVTKILSSEVQQ